MVFPSVRQKVGGIKLAQINLFRNLYSKTEEWLVFKWNHYQTQLITKQ